MTMKGFKTNIIFIAFLWLAFLHVSPAEAQTTYLDDMQVSLGNVSVRDRMVSMELFINWEAPHVSPQHSLRLTPVIFSKDSSECYYFRPVMVEGRIREKADRRRIELGRDSVFKDERDSSIILKVKRSEDKAYRYFQQAAYHPWMLDGRVFIHEEIIGCAECVKGDSLMLLSGAVLPPYVPQWSGLDFMLSPKGDDKDREKKHAADLQFPLNMAVIYPDYMDNRKALDEISESIKEANESTVFEITGIRIIGYASFDGPVDFNRRLAYDRARSLADYLMGANPEIPDSLYKVQNGEEDWESLKEAVAAHPVLSGNRSLMKIISSINDSNQDSCEMEIKKDYATYDILRNEILIPMRRIEYSIEYQVRDFTPEEAMAFWKEHPEWLSINELNSVADTYGEDSEEYNDVLLKAAVTYPLDVAARANAALALYNDGDTSAARSLLEGRNEPELLNILGVMLARDKEYGKAMECFERSSSAGDIEAARNAEELGKVLEQL